MAYGENRVQVATALFSHSYGVDRVQVASDTFDSSISGNWTNGPGDWLDWQWVSGGEIDPVNDASYTGMYYTGSTFAGNHYSKITIQAMGSAADYLGPIVRGQSGSSASYALEIAEQENRRRILEFTTGPGETTLAEDAGGSGFPTAAGDTLTLECEGTTLRGGDDMDGSDGQMLTTTDNTLSGGSPGIYGWGDTVNVTAWEGGNISFGNWNNGPGTTAPWNAVSGGVECSFDVNTSMVRTTESYNNDQYCRVTIDTQTLNFIAFTYAGAGVRFNGDPDGYVGYAVAGEDFYRIFEAADGSYTELGTGAEFSGELPLDFGEILTMEAEGTTLRVGSNAAGSDTLKFSTTDNTIASGKPSIEAFVNTGEDVIVDAWEGGNIDAVAWPPGGMEGTGNKLRVVSSPLRW